MRHGSCGGTHAAHPRRARGAGDRRAHTRKFETSPNAPTHGDHPRRGITSTRVQHMARREARPHHATQPSTRAKNSFVRGATYTAAPASECGGRQGRATPTPQYHLPMNEARHASRANWTTLETGKVFVIYDFTTMVVISFPRDVRPTSCVLARRCRRAGVPVDATHTRARCVHMAQHECLRRSQR